MAKVITFSRTFPAYHPRAGKPTYFVEQFWNSFNIKSMGEEFIFHNDLIDLMALNPKLKGYSSILIDFTKSLKNQVKFLDKKNHTIRAGHRFKKGDFFSPRVWGTDINPKSGRSGPYHSKQIILAPDTEILEVWDITINEWTSVCVDGKFLSVHQDIELAHNDGLKVEDFFNWFSKMPFEGQIICWKENIKY